MNDVEERIEKLIKLLDLKGYKDIANIKKCTMTQFKTEVLFTDSLVLKSLKATIEQIETKVARVNVYRYNVVDSKERTRYEEQITHKKFNEEMYEGQLYYIEVAKTKKPLILIYKDCSEENPYNSDNINEDKFVVIF